MGAAGASAFRTIDRGHIVEHFLQFHFGWTYGGVATDVARREVEGAIDAWIGLGLGVATGPDGAQRFDPVEATNFMVGAGRRGEDDFWEKHQVATLRGHMRDQQGLAPDSPDIPDLASLAPRSFRLRIEREYDLGHVPEGSRLRLRLPVPIEDHALRQLEVRCEVPPGATTKLEQARLDVRLVTGAPGPLTIAVEAGFEAHVDPGGNGALDARGREVHTRPRELLIRVDERANGLARSVTAGLRDDWSRVMAIHDHLLDRFQFGMVDYHAIDPERPGDHIFRTGVYDCHNAAALFCSLCRALGIPARLVNGFDLFARELCHHYWAEAWIEGRGWTGIDFTGWMLSRGGRDAGWRDLLAGVLDFRVKTQVFPEIHTGPGSVRLPPAWRMLSFRRGAVHETAFLDARSGATVYKDRLSLV